MFKKSLFCFILSIIISCIYLHGKEFTMITFDEFDNIDELKFVNDTGLKKVVLEKYFVNNSYSIPKHNFLSFFAYDETSKETSTRPILEIEFKDQVNNYLILLEKNRNNRSGIKYTFLNNDSEFPKLSTLIFNRSDIPVIAKVGSKFFKISPQSKRNLKFELGNKGSFKEDVSFAFRRSDKSIEYIYSSFWKLYEHQKKICFIDYNEKNNNLEFRDFLMH